MRNAHKITRTHTHTQTYTEGPGPTSLSGIAAWVAHAQEAEADLQSAAGVMREGLTLSNQPNPNSIRSRAPSCVSTFLAPAAQQQPTPHLQLPRSFSSRQPQLPPPFSTSPSRRLQALPSGLSAAAVGSASRRLRAQQSDVVRGSDAGAHGEEAASQLGTENAAEPGTDNKGSPSVYQQLLRR